MAVIGFFEPAAGGFAGMIETLTSAAAIEIRPNQDKAGEAAPDYRVFRGSSEIGAAWAKLSKAGRRFYVVQIDDPAFARPIECRLVEAAEGYRLMWSR